MSLVKLLAQFHMQTETSSPLFFYIVIISVKLWTGNTINFRTFGVSGNSNEKSLVENLVGYSRRNFLVPVPRINNIEELNRKLWNDCMSYREKHKVAHRQHTVHVMYQEESRFLNTIPRYRFDTSKTAMAKVDDFSTVRYERNMR